MRTHFSHLAVALLTGTLAVACSRNDVVDNPRKVQSSDRIERIALDGCVQAAPGSANQFILNDVSEGGLVREQQHQARTPITRGSWVRLAMGGDDLKNHLGKRVRVMGEVRETGENTIGTAGQEKDAPRASVANGNAPLIAVEKIEQAEGTCAGADAGSPGSRN